MKASDLKLRIDEMIRIKGTVSLELRELESRRQKLQFDISSYSSKIDELKQELSRQQTELDRLKISVEQAQFAQREAVLRNTPELALPRALYSAAIPKTYPSPARDTTKACKMASCFDHSRCSLTSGFPVYLYDSHAHKVVNDDYEVDGFLKTTVKQTFGFNGHLTSDPKAACVFFILVGESLVDTDQQSNGRYAPVMIGPKRSTLNVTRLRGLPYWGGDGRNHVLLNFARRDLSITAEEVFGNQPSIGRAMLAQSTFRDDAFRTGFDLVIPPILGPPGGDVWQVRFVLMDLNKTFLLF